MAKYSGKRTSSVGPIYVFAVVWALLALTTPIYKLSAILITLAASLALSQLSRPVFARLAAKSIARSAC